jgi:hypothetical protein
MSQIAKQSTGGGGGGDVNSLTPDVGAAVGAVGGTIPTLGYQASTVQTMRTYNDGAGNFRIADQTWETQYVVDTSTTPGLMGTFQTIQSAIAAAVADGAALGNYKKIYIRTGTYTENLTLPAGIMLVGQTFPFTGTTPITPYQSTVIVGNHTFTGSAVLSFENLNFMGVSGDLFSGGSIVVLNCGNCFFANTANFLFNITSTSSALRFYECTFASSGQDLFNLDTNELWMRSCHFEQTGQIVQNNASINLTNVTNIGAIKSTNGQLMLESCTFTSIESQSRRSRSDIKQKVSCISKEAITAV